MRLTLRVAAATLVLLSFAPCASAKDFKLFGREWSITITNSFDYTYFSDNDGIKDDPSTPGIDEDGNSEEDDNYHRLFNSFDFNLGTGDVRFGARIDIYAYFNTPFERLCGPAGRQPPPFSWCSQRTRRFVSHYGLYRKTVVLPERIYLTVAKPAYDLTLGDFYASFGKGIALNAVKFDNVGQDNMIRGGKLLIHHNDFGLTFIAGQFNILDTDEATGRIGDANFPRSHFGNAPPGTRRERVLDAPWEPSPIIAGRVEYRFAKKVLVGLHSVWLLQNRAGDSTNGQDYDLVNGLTIAAPDLLDDSLSISFEIDMMRSLRDGTVVRGPGFDDAGFDESYWLMPGIAAYLSLNYSLDNTTINFELKHYDDYTVAPISVGDVPYPLIWATPPTLERVIAEVNDNQTNTGVRLRIDQNLEKVGPFEWLVYASYSFQRSRYFGQHRLHDTFIGSELQWQGGKGHWNTRVGFRHEWDLESDNLYRRDIFWQGDIEQPIGKNMAAQLTWLYQRRTRRLFDLVHWNVLDLALQFKWSPYISAAFTVELQSDPQVVVESKVYFGGSIRYFFSPSTFVGLRFGQNRPGLKCLNGICRIYPAFAGVRLLGVVRL